MARKIERRDFFKASLVKTGAGYLALSELFGPGALAKGFHWVKAAEWPENGPSCRIVPAGEVYRIPRTWILTYKAGDEGLPLGWALMIRCLAPIQPMHKLAVLSSDPLFQPTVTIKENVAIPRVIWIEPHEYALKPGEKIWIRLENYTFPIITARCGFAVCEVDPNGTNPEIGSNLTFLEVPTEGGAALPKAPGGFEVVVPSRAQTMKPIRIRLAALDVEQLGTPEYTGTVKLKTDTPFFGLPEEVTFKQDDEGSLELIATPLTPGIIRIKATDGALAGESNPCVCTQEPVEDQVYWGEYHKHSFHDDGHLEPDEHYRYARQYAFLDWGMLSSHDTWPAPRKGARNWPLLHAATEDANQPGEFVTFQGYEWTHNCPFSPDDARGHKVIFFLDPDRLLPIIPYCYDFEENDPPYMPPTTLMNELIKRAGKDVIVIPHHLPLYKWWNFPQVTATEMGGPLPTMPRKKIDELQPVAEVFSKVQGMNESWDLQNWIKPPAKWFGAPILHTFWLDGLKAGARAGAVCAGDNHYRPMGQPAHTALAGVMAPELTREAIFRAIQKRRTYGTSGPRVFIHYTLNGLKMGEIKKCFGAWKNPRIEAALVAPCTIDSVEIVKVTPGHDEVAHVHHPLGNARYCHFIWEDAGPAPGDWVCYYLRAHLDGNKEGAWTSPIWLETFAPDPHQHQ